MLAKLCYTEKIKSNPCDAKMLKEEHYVWQAFVI
jgi:hypothetical protein